MAVANRIRLQTEVDVRFKMTIPAALVPEVNQNFQGHRMKSLLCYTGLINIR